MTGLGFFTRCALVAASIAMLATTVHAASANGVWQRSNGARIKVFSCGGGIGMKVIKSPSPKKVGKTIMCGAKKTGGNSWSGSLLNLDDGQTYTGKVTVNGNSMSLQGCVLGGLICDGDTWKRVK